jgi:Zn-finger nucleic acid-binding protein
VIPGARVDDIWLTATAEPVISPYRGKCPECRRVMHAVLVPWQNREIELDLCRPCQRLWMDNAENSAPLSIGATGTASRLAAFASLRKPPVVRTGQSAREDKVSEEFYAKLLKVRNILEKRGEPRATHRAAFALLVMVVGWIVAKRLGFH